jgi:hypothetical protein
VPLCLARDGQLVADCPLVLSADQAAELTREMLDLLVQYRVGNAIDPPLQPDMSRRRVLLDSMFIEAATSDDAEPEIAGG